MTMRLPLFPLVLAGIVAIAGCSVPFPQPLDFPGSTNSTGANSALGGDSFNVSSKAQKHSDIYFWSETTLDLIARYPVVANSPPRATRASALVHVAINKAVVKARAAGASESAAIAAAASVTLAFLFPDQARKLLAMAQGAYGTRSKGGKSDRSEVLKGRKIGEQVAGLIIVRAKADGGQGTEFSGIPDVYQAFLPGFGWTNPHPLEPTAGSWKPWGLTAGDQFRLGLPPAPGSMQLNAEIAALLDLQATRTPDQVAIARKWAATPCAVQWNEIALDLSKRHGFDAARTAHTLGLLNAILADAFIAAWDSKFVYYQPRPDMLEPAIETVIPTPPHPAYPSGHSTEAAAAARYLVSVFPQDAAYLNAQATESSLSRQYAGIHYLSDAIAGEALGRRVADHLIGLADANGNLP